MNCGDRYQELLLYLEQTENEIAKAFEEVNQNNHQFKIKEKEKIKECGPNDETDIDFLIELNETIKSDVTELLARNHAGKNSILHCQLNQTKVNGINSNCEDHYVNNFFDDKKLLIQHSHFENNIYREPADGYAFRHSAASEQMSCRSHNMSQDLEKTHCFGHWKHNCSTNLTWASDCSSSPCLTSTSDSELLDEDAHSTSSRDTRELLFANGATKHHRQQVLGSKSSSTPVLKIRHYKVNKQCRSQSDRHLAEIEAAEACKWLRATGFPQYAQLYEDNQFPIDVTTAAQDHPLLEPDVLHALFRRLQILNSCAHLHQQRVAHTDESEDECCALSDNWTYQSDIRRWSRTCNNTPFRNIGEASSRQDSLSKKEEEVFDKSTGDPKDRLRRAGSTKYRRRRDGVLFSEKDNILDTLSQQLNQLKSSEVNHVSDSEVTPRHSRRSRTKSFDKTDAWSHPQGTTDRVIWHKLPETKELLSPVRDISFDNDGPPISHLSATQLQVLRKLALLKLTSHMEKYCPSHRTGWNWDLPKFIRKIKAPIYKDKNIFGVPLTINFQRTGQVLPRQIEEAMRWLQDNAADQVGIFRKPGVKSRIQMLHNQVEANIAVDFSDQQCYDVADLLKQYFRELPEVLLTSKLSETFILIFQFVPLYLRRESVLCALLLLPDEHSEVLQSLLHFLLVIAENSQSNQMSENNLAMCFAPTLFQYSQTYKHNLGYPHPKELAENKAGHECLLFVLKNFNSLFRIPRDFINQCNSSEMKDTKAKLLADLGKEMGGWKEYLNECQINLLKETRDKGRGWIPVSSHNSKVDVFYKKIADGLPLRFWKVTGEVEAPPSEVMRRILRERHIWDQDLHSAKITAQLDGRTEVFQYVRKNISPLPNEEYCVLRRWRCDLPKETCIIVETSVEYPDAVSIPNTVRGIILASRYLIEPCGSGKSRLIHFSRVDTMGRTPDWYQKNFGHLCAIFVGNIQNSFYQNASGPESKV